MVVRTRAQKASAGLGGIPKLMNQTSIADFYIPLPSGNQLAGSPATSSRPDRDHTSNAPFSADKDNATMGNISLVNWDLNWSVDPGLQTRSSILSEEPMVLREPIGSKPLANDSLNSETSIFNLPNHLCGDEPLKVPPDRQNEQITTIMMQLRDQYFLSAKTTQMIFDKLNTLQQDILSVKVNLQLLVSLFNTGLLNAAPPPRVQSPANEWADLGEDSGDAADTSGIPLGNQSFSRRIEELLTVQLEQMETGNQIPEGDEEDAPNLTFSNPDLVVTDEWQNASTVESWPSQTHTVTKGHEVPGKLPLQTLSDRSAYDKDKRASQPPTKSPHDGENITIYNWCLKKSDGSWLSNDEVKRNLLNIIGHSWDHKWLLNCSCSYPTNPHHSRGRVHLSFKDSSHASSLWNLLHKLRHYAVSFKWGLHLDRSKPPAQTHVQQHFSHLSIRSSCPKATQVRRSPANCWMRKPAPESRHKHHHHMMAQGAASNSRTWSPTELKLRNKLPRTIADHLSHSIPACRVQTKCPLYITSPNNIQIKPQPMGYHTTGNGHHRPPLGKSFPIASQTNSTGNDRNSFSQTHKRQSDTLPRAGMRYNSNKDCPQSSQIYHPRAPQKL